MSYNNRLKIISDGYQMPVGSAKHPASKQHSTMQIGFPWNLSVCSNISYPKCYASRISCMALIQQMFQRSIRSISSWAKIWEIWVQFLCAISFCSMFCWSFLPLAQRLHICCSEIIKIWNNPLKCICSFQWCLSSYLHNRPLFELSITRCNQVCSALVLWYMEWNWKIFKGMGQRRLEILERMLWNLKGQWIELESFYKKIWADQAFIKN